VRSDLNHWIQEIRKGEARPVARALTEIENRGPRSRTLLRSLFPYSGKALRLGVTGAPGVGKSTLISQITANLRRQDCKVAIVGVDPTSPYSGGSILGDRVRMQSHHGDPGVFVRSMATRGVLGGLAPTTADVVTVLEAAGYDAVLIETVGVGQAEIEIMKWVSQIVLVLTPGMGDDVQMMKAGVMEIADVFLINKSDQDGASQLESQLRSLLALLPEGAPWPSIVRTVATTGEGVDQLMESLSTRPGLLNRLVGGWKERLASMVQQEVVEHIQRCIDDARFEKMAHEIVEGRQNPYELVEAVVAEVKNAKS